MPNDDDDDDDKPPELEPLLPFPIAQSHVCELERERESKRAR